MLLADEVTRRDRKSARQSRAPGRPDAAAGLDDAAAVTYDQQLRAS
jgi:hypothetical protein